MALSNNKLMKALSSATLLCLFSSVQVKTALGEGDTCRVLAMQGGGIKGAYEAGAFQGLVDAIGEETEYDVVTGVSIGGINASLVATFEKGKEQEAAKELTEHYLVHSTDLFEPVKWWEYATFLIFSKSIASNKLIKDDIGQDLAGTSFKRKLQISSLDMNTGRVHFFNQDTIPEDRKVDYVRATGNLPMVFEPIKVGKWRLADPGLVSNTNVANAVKTCIEMGFQEEDIVLDLIADPTSSEIIDIWDYMQAKIAKVFQLNDRVNKQFMLRFWSMTDIAREMKQFPNVNYRYYITPSKDLPVNPILPVSMTKKEKKWTWKLGYNDAKKVVKMGECQAFKRLVDVA